MQRELAITAITQGMLGIVLLAVLSVLLCALRNDIRQKKRVGHIVVFTLAMLGLWCFLALQHAYVSVRKLILTESVSEQQNRGGRETPSNGAWFYSLLNHERSRLHHRMGVEMQQ